MSTISQAIKTDIKNWWWFIIKGILFVVAAIAILYRPAEGYLGLSIFFSLIIIGAGFTQIFFALANREVLAGWGWTLASGLIDLVIGIYLFSLPVLTMATLPFILGFWLMFRAFYIMGFSFDVKNMGLPDWGWILFGGIGLAVISFLILYFPVAGAASIVIYSSLAFFVAGITSFWIAFKLKKLNSVAKTFIKK